MFGNSFIKPGTMKSEDAYDRIIEFVLDLDEDQTEDIITSMVETEVIQGDVVIREGEDGDNFYVIEKGIFKVSKMGKYLFRYDHKGSFGELALMYNCPRAATAETDGVLWAIDRITFRSLTVDSMVQKRRRSERILNKMQIFRDLPLASVSIIADCLTREFYPAGTTIIKENEELKSDAKFFIVEKGTIQCFKTIQGTKRLVLTIEAGGFFGEVALISKQNRQADCIAKTEATLLSMGRDAFERLMGPVEITLFDRIKDYGI